MIAIQPIFEKFDDSKLHTLAAYVTIIGTPISIAFAFIVAFRKKIREKIRYSRFDRYTIPRLFTNILEHFNKSKQVKIKSSKIIGQTPNFPQLKRLEIKLNKSPDYEWENYFKHPGAYKVARRIGNVSGNKIIIDIEDRQINETIEDAKNYISQANKKYQQSQNKTNQRKIAQKTKEKEEQKKVKELNKNMKEKKE